MWSAILLYDANAGYEKRIGRIRLLLSELKQKWQFESTFLEASQITSEQVFRFLNDIRSTSPQARGRIVTSRSHVLPLSGKKNLNLSNTPVLILYESGRPVTVYPHLLGTFYRDVEDSLEEIARYGPSRTLESRGILEDPICKILADDPSLLGSGMKTLGTEVSTSTGKIDLLLRDDQETWIVVEVETHASDFAVAQVCRLAAGYSKDNNVDLGRIRRIVVCRSFEKNLIETARTAAVELYRIMLTREA
jgi:hypothetical protein